MPPSSKRKKAEDTTSSPGKKLKTEDSSDINNSDGMGRKREWEVRSGKKNWKPYDPAQNKTISQAFGSQDSVALTTPKATYSIIFERMVQRNVNSGWEIPIRCKQDEDPLDKEYVWQWKDEQSFWNTYSEGVSRLLDAAKAYDLKSVSFHEEKIHYTVNIAKNQLVNNSTKAKSSVRYILQEVADKEALAKTTKPVSKSHGKKERSSKASSTMKEEKKSLKSVVFQGKSPVDDVCPIKDKVHVFCEGDLIWDAMLNQTNLKNNNNKYYLMQLLEDVNTNRYHVWFRWGRVGFPGQNSLTSFGGDLGGAKNAFEKKFTDKTKNRWEDKDSFEKVPGKYDLIFVDYNAEEKDETDAPAAPPKPKTESKLDKRLQLLIELICNVKTMEDAVKEMKYDTNKAPLGKLTKEQIKAGFAALKRIDQCITSGDLGSKLVEACDAFYTRIPHCFGMRQPPLIRTKEDVKLKIELLETLGDIEIAMKVLKEHLDENPIDSHYKALKCELSPLDRTDSDFEMIERYIKNTHAKTHNQYTITVLDVFGIDHPSGSGFVDHGNSMLLWHGSRLSNWVGILTQGLRIAPPEAPVTGYMFGKGVYFADICSKSANYCYTNRRQNMGLLVLSEVSLGKTNDLLSADYDAGRLPSGCHSVKGLGSIAPDPKENHVMSNGTVVPLGKGVDTGVKNPNGYTLNYNEYIVYDTKQIKMKYLVKCKFNYK